MTLQAPFWTSRPSSNLAPHFCTVAGVCRRTECRRNRPDSERARSRLGPRAAAHQTLGQGATASKTDIALTETKSSRGKWPLADSGVTTSKNKSTRAGAAQAGRIRGAIQAARASQAGSNDNFSSIELPLWTSTGTICGFRTATSSHQAGFELRSERWGGGGVASLATEQL